MILALLSNSFGYTSGLTVDFRIVVVAHMTDLQAKLASLPIFKALDAEELASIAGQVQWLGVAGGWTLISEGDEADDMFVVLSGRLGVLSRILKGSWSS